MSTFKPLSFLEDQCPEIKRMARYEKAGPFVKWVGGKRQLLDDIIPLIPESYGTYYEPFIGAGAVLLYLQPERAVINDINGELVNTYKSIKADVDSLIENLEGHENTEEYFYNIRDLDRDPDVFSKLSPIERASRFIYLNKTCFNGLYRVNSSGEFNASYGFYDNPSITSERVLRDVSNYMNDNKVKIVQGSYEKALEAVSEQDFVYLDPPYDPVSDTASFTGYTKQGFGREDQSDLKEQVDLLTEKGCHVLLSNSSTEFIRDLYSEYDIHIVQATRKINSDATKRGSVDEVIVSNASCFE